MPLGNVLDQLGQEGILTLITETGTRLNTALLAAGLVDRVHLFISPQIMGSDAVPAFGSMHHAIRMGEVEVERYENDLGLSSLLRDPWPLLSPCSLSPLLRILVDHPLIQSNGLVRNSRPGELLLHPPPPGLPKSPRLLRILHQFGDLRRQLARKLLRVGRKPRQRILVEMHQVTRLVIHHHFQNSTRSAGHHRRAARHRLQVDDPERLVD